MPSAAALILALTGALNAFDTLFRLPVAVELATETALAALGTYLFHMALTSAPIREERDELRRNAGGILLLCCLLMALGRISIPGGLCLGRIPACFCVMVAAFGGYEFVMRAYKEAVAEKYRFLTYGDAMLIL